jgi:phospholipase D1/2
MQQWIASLEKMAQHCHWSGTNRFDSFAPIRLNVAAQWLVDGVRLFSFFLSFLSVVVVDAYIATLQRDYFWNFSRAILLAKERIYIHDWWLSPGSSPLF